LADASTQTLGIEGNLKTHELSFARWLLYQLCYRFDELLLTRPGRYSLIEVPCWGQRDMIRLRRNGGFNAHQILRILSYGYTCISQIYVGQYIMSILCPGFEKLPSINYIW